jgi:hypothetical protein
LEISTAPHVLAITVVYFSSPKVPLVHEFPGTFIFNNLLEIAFFLAMYIYRLHFQKPARRKALAGAQDFSRSRELFGPGYFDFDFDFQPSTIG